MAYSLVTQWHTLATLRLSLCFLPVWLKVSCLFHPPLVIYAHTLDGPKRMSHWILVPYTGWWGLLVLNQAMGYQYRVRTSPAHRQGARNLAITICPCLFIDYNWNIVGKGAIRKWVSWIVRSPVTTCWDDRIAFTSGSQLSFVTALLRLLCCGDSRCKWQLPWKLRFVPQAFPIDRLGRARPEHWMETASGQWPVTRPSELQPIHWSISIRVANSSCLF